MKVISNRALKKSIKEDLMHSFGYNKLEAKKLSSSIYKRVKHNMNEAYVDTIEELVS